MTLRLLHSLSLNHFCITDDPSPSRGLDAIPFQRAWQFSISILSIVIENGKCVMENTTYVCDISNTFISMYSIYSTIHKCYLSMHFPFHIFHRKWC